MTSTRSENQTVAQLFLPARVSSGFLAQATPSRPTGAEDEGRKLFSGQSPRSEQGEQDNQQDGMAEEGKQEHTAESCGDTTPAVEPITSRKYMSCGRIGRKASGSPSGTRGKGAVRLCTILHSTGKPVFRVTTLLTSCLKCNDWILAGGLSVLLHLDLPERTAEVHLFGGLTY